MLVEHRDDDANRGRDCIARLQRCRQRSERSQRERRSKAFSLRRLRGGSLRWQRRTFLLAYGLLICAISLSALGQTAAQVNLMSSRDTQIRASLDMLRHGGPLLVGGGPGTDDGAHDAALYPIGVTDDQGIYVFLPLLGRVLSIDDPAVLMRILYLGALALPLAAYPLLFEKMFGSVLAGLLAPVALLAQFRFMPDDEIYWISGWATVVGIPIVCVALRLDPRRAAIPLVCAVILASFATSIRSHAGLPVAVAALLVMVWLRTTWRHRALIGVLIVIGYLSIASFGLAGLRLYRDAWAGRELAAGLPTAHPFWHPAYLGLGYLPNPYGIEFNDPVAAAAVERDDPGAPYLSERYESSLRRQYFAIVLNDPAFAAQTYGGKLSTLIGHAWEQWWTLILLLPVLFWVGYRRDAASRYLALGAPAVAVGGLPPLMTLPVPAYEVGWLVGWGILWQIAIAWSNAAIEAGIVKARVHGLSALRTGLAAGMATTYAWVRMHLKLSIALAIASVLVSGGIYRVNTEAQAMAEYQTGHARLVPRSDLLAFTAISWDFSGGVDPDWSMLGGGRAARGNEVVVVETAPAKYTYQMWTTPHRLGVGRYQFTVEGRPTKGEV